MSSKDIRVGLVGAGYIASWHVQALKQLPDVKVTAVCDPAVTAAKALADRNDATAFSSIPDMLDAGVCDAVHILTPPHLHRQHAEECLKAGMHVLVEKPFALSASDGQAMVEAARLAKRIIAVNHNFLGLPSYERLKKLIAEGYPGRIDIADLHWRYPLTPLRSGPYGLWMLRSAENLLLELGPHLYAFAIDLFGSLEKIDLRLSKPVSLPTGIEMPQGWSISATAGHTDISMSLSLVEGPDDRSVTLRGISGTARLDLANDTLILDRPNNADIIVNPLLHEMSLAGQHLKQGSANAIRQLRSLNQKSPYALGFIGSLGAFYDAVKRNGEMDARFSGETAVLVIDAVEKTLATLPEKRPVQSPAMSASATLPPASALVIGGTGFIGRYLTRKLVKEGKRVRVLSRGSANPFNDLGDAVEIAPVSARDEAGLRAAMKDMETVYHLGRATETTWEGYLENDVNVTRRIGEAATAAGVGVFIYTGTIDSYDASRANRPITEETGFGSSEAMEGRNLYARSKALCETTLQEIHTTSGLPLVIARPGIVVGPGGPLQHWGIGRWSGSGAVTIWGNGRNILPFVLVEDVADALASMAGRRDLVGESFNLIGEPLMSARDYFNAIYEVTGTRINMKTGNLSLFYATDVIKYNLKRHALGKRNLPRPSRTDWLSRAHLSPYRNDHAKKLLGWQPENDRQRFAERMIGGDALFGF